MVLVELRNQRLQHRRTETVFMPLGRIHQIRAMANLSHHHERQISQVSIISDPLSSNHAIASLDDLVTIPPDFVAWPRTRMTLPANAI